MKLFAHLLRLKWFAWTVVAITLVFAAVSLALSVQVVQDDDLLAFLPEGNEDIKAFQNINERFGGMDVALVGMETDNPFDGDFLSKLKVVTDALNAHEHVDYALSLTNIEDYAPDPMGGVQQGALIEEIPQSAEAQAALRTKVMSKDHLLGNVISADGRGIIIYAFATYGTDARDLSATIEGIVRDAFPESNANVSVFWGGAPFISSYIFTACQQDLKWLSPLAVIVIIAIILLSFRDWIGSALALLSTLIGVFSSQAAMVICGISYNIVLSGMPVILFAVGSAYSIHMLSRYYANARQSTPEEALERTLVETGPIVIAAGLTTVAGLGSFVVMDIAPMRTFGIFTALGILITLITSVFFVPAVIRLVGMQGRASTEGSLYSALLRIAELAQYRRTTGIMGLAVLLLFGGMLVGRVDSRVDQSAFFSPGSAPDQAQRFLDSRFGGSQFLQVHFKGEVSDAHVLREMRRLADEIRVLPDVSDVIHIGEIIALINDAMDGDKRVPDSSDQANALLRFLTGNRSVTQVITEDRTEALLHVKIGSNTTDALERVLTEVETILKEKAVTSYTIAPLNVAQQSPGQDRIQQLVASRINAVIVEYGAIAGSLTPENLAERIASRPTAVPAGSVSANLKRWLQSEECWVELTNDQAQRAADAWASLGPDTTEESVAATLQTALAETVAEEEMDAMVQDLVMSAQTQVDDIWRRVRSRVHANSLLTALKVLPPEGPSADRFRSAIASALMDLDNATVLLPAAQEEDAKVLAAHVTGLPQLYRGLSHSIASNQIKSLAVALGLVLLIMTFMFRSFTAGLVATSPTFFTLLVVYGAMGLMEVHLDIGTSMLASLIIGAGVDYSVHLMAAWDGDSTLNALRHSVRETAPAIWTNAFMVAAGFFVLSLGEARPLQNVGLLTAAAMLAAAVGTFLVIPVFARRNQYRRPVL